MSVKELHLPYLTYETKACQMHVKEVLFRYLTCDFGAYKCQS